MFGESSKGLGQGEVLQQLTQLTQYPRLHQSPLSETKIGEMASPEGVPNGSSSDIQTDDKTLVVKPEDQFVNSDNNSNSDAEKGQVSQEVLDWDNDPHNPYNWPAWRKGMMVFTISTMGLTM